MTEKKEKNIDPRILFCLLIVLGLGAVLFSFYKFYLLKDYSVSGEVSCDPATESCFVYVCNPEEEECTGDPEQDTFYYKLIYKKAYNIPICDKILPGCEELFCEESEADCSIVTCNSEEDEGCVYEPVLEEDASGEGELEDEILLEGSEEVLDSVENNGLEATQDDKTENNSQE